MTDCEEKTETVASLYSHFFSNLVQGQDPPPPLMNRLLGGWAVLVDLCRLTLCHIKKMGCNSPLQMLILFIPVTFPSIIMELCWSHVFPARRTDEKPRTSLI